MKRNAGMWIDHREAVIVFIGETEEEIQKIESKVERKTRFSGHATLEQGVAEDQRDRQYETHLNRYYDDLLARLKDADTLYIFGPGEAKGEFAKRIIKSPLRGHVIGIDTVDKMTVPQIAAKVRLRFSTPVTRH